MSKTTSEIIDDVFCEFIQRKDINTFSAVYAASVIAEEIKSALENNAEALDPIAPKKA